LRAKIDMSSSNMLLRDPLLYRIKHSPPHHRTQNDWPIYPMYDFAHPLSDAIEGITHSICTLEFDVHRPLYDWLVDKLYGAQNRPHQYEMARLNLEHTLTSKRKLLKLVQEGVVSGWDDPRLATIAGIRRRGIPPGAIRRFCKMVGVARSEGVVEMAMLESAIRDELNEDAPRVMAVLDPIKVTLTNWPEGKVEELEAPLYPEALMEKKGDKTRKIKLTKEIFIEGSDFMEDPPKKYFRLKPGGEVRLRYGYIIKCDEVIKDPESGKVTELKCTYDPDTKSGSGQTRKVKGTIHWVSASESVPAEVRLYETILSVPNADDALAADESKTILDLLNPNSLKEMKQARLEAYIGEDVERYNAGASAGDGLPRYQFERNGFFALDKPVVAPENSENKLIFNRIVELRDTWAKIGGNKKQQDPNKNQRSRGAGGGRGGRAPAVEVPDFHQVELRVGKIVEVWPHPDAEKLWCEKIDLGEPEGPRTIVSGLRAHYSQEELEGKNVVVFANLKYSKLRGIESQGMVLAASNADHSTVELVEPPAAAQPGDRLSAEGIDIKAHPLPANKINPKAKTSVWPRVQEKLNVDGQGVPMFDGKPLVVAGSACSVSTLKDAAIG